MLCKFNISIIIVLIPMHNVINVKDSRIIGIVGKYMQGILDIKGFRNRCQIIKADQMGKNYLNGSSDGALSLLIENKGDFVFRKEAHHLINDKLELTPTIAEEYFKIMHTVSIPSEYQIKEIQIIKGLKRFLSIRIVLIHLIGILLIEILLFLIIIHLILNLNLELSCKNLINIFLYHQKLFFENLNNLTAKYFKSALLLMTIFLIIHSFFKNISINSIKSDKVIVDTSSLILNKDDIFNNYRNVCWMLNEIDSEIFKNSPKNSFLYRFWIKKNSPIPCFFKKTSPGIYLNLFKTHFLMTKRTVIQMLLQFYYKFIPYKVWISDHDFHKVSTFYYVNKRSTLFNKNEINKFALYMNQFQLVEYNRFMWFNGLFFDGRRVVDDLSTYIQENTSFDNLKINDYLSYLLLYALICAILFILFIANLLFNYLLYFLN